MTRPRHLTLARNQARIPVARPVLHREPLPPRTAFRSLREPVATPAPSIDRSILREVVA